MNGIRHYVTIDGRDLIDEWLSGLRDVKAKTAIIRRLNKVESGNFGDHEPCRNGVWELRIDRRCGGFETPQSGLEQAMSLVKREINLSEETDARQQITLDKLAERIQRIERRLELS